MKKSVWQHPVAKSTRLSDVLPASAGAFVRIVAVSAALICTGVVFGQTPQYSVTPSVVDSVPQTTVVPVQQTPSRIVMRTTVYEESTRNMDRTERRAYRAKVYAAQIDSLVQSRNYLFFPVSMQEIPGGLVRSVFADYFYFGMFVDHVEVHLPTERGITQYVEILNFDSMSVRNYQAAQVQWGWSVSFNVANGDDLYHVDLAVSTATGETVLTLILPAGVTMRYNGELRMQR